MKRINWQSAENILKHRVDRRCAYAMHDDETPCDLTGSKIFQLCEYTDSCSGCTETVEGYNVFGFPAHPKHNCLVGAGCHECGYHGVVRHSTWVPYVEWKGLT